MTTKLEELARAFIGGKYPGLHEEDVVEIIERQIPGIRAVMEALKEPTEEMIHAGIHAPAWDLGPTAFGKDYVEPPPIRGFPAPIWRAMLTSIIQEHEGEG